MVKFVNEENKKLFYCNYSARLFNSSPNLSYEHAERQASASASASAAAAPSH